MTGGVSKLKVVICLEPIVCVLAERLMMSRQSEPIEKEPPNN